MYSIVAITEFPVKTGFVTELEIELLQIFRDMRLSPTDVAEVMIDNYKTKDIKLDTENKDYRNELDERITMLDKFILDAFYKE